MAKDKERSVNPAAQQRKAEKAKAIKKSKTEQLNRRNEQLAKRNPNRVQQQIDDLKALEASGQIKQREKTILAELERDLKAIKKAKETVGDTAPQNTRVDRPHQQRDNRHSTGSVLGKRRHDGERKKYGQGQESDSGNETDESVRRIPMPRDTPPPIPRRMPYNNQLSNPNKSANNPNNIPVASSSHDRSQNTDELPVKPTTVIEAKTTYSSAPQIRDLKKEAISRFVPTAVKRKIDAVKGTGTALLEPEEMDRLEAEGYSNTRNLSKIERNETSHQIQAENADENEDEDEEAKRLAEEEARFQHELQAMEGDQGENMDIDKEEDIVNQNQYTESHTHINNIHISSPPQSHDSETRKEVETTTSTTKSQKPNQNPTSSSSLLLNYGSDSESESEIDPQSSTQPQSQTPHKPSGAFGGGGLFSTLPKPKSRTVEMEEVEDEDS